MACGGSGEKPETVTGASTQRGAVEIIDLQTGSYRGIRIETTLAALLARHGKGVTSGPATTLANPDGSDGPPVFGSPGPEGARRSSHRYEHLVVFLIDRRVHTLLVDSPRARTREGVAVGDKLERVSETYPAARCGLAQEGTEYEPYPACYLLLSGVRHVWFGGDPIRSITVARMRIGDL